MAAGAKARAARRGREQPPGHRAGTRVEAGARPAAPPPCALE